MTDFKAQVEQDSGGVFLNLGGFAEMHRIEGVEIPVVIDNDQLVKMKQGQILGIVEADMLIFGKVSDFPENMAAGRIINVDGREFVVANSGVDMGIMEVALSQSRTA